MSQLELGGPPSLSVGDFPVPFADVVATLMHREPTTELHDLARPDEG